MFDPVPDLNLEAHIELGDVNIDITKSRVGESNSYISKSRRLFVHKTKDEERKLALRFFLPRIYFLSYKEVNYLFRCIDTIKDVHITKKNNIIVAPYMILLTLSSKGYKFTESMIELFFPELYNENSKKFKFVSQICIIQEKLGYPVSHYHCYDFESYYSSLALSLRSDTSDVDIFDSRKESEFITSLSEITYRFYTILLKSNSIQWSSSTGSVVNQMINTVLSTIHDIIISSDNTIKGIDCKLATETKLPLTLLIDRITLFDRIITEIKSTNSFKISKRDKQTFLKYITIYY
ncbi:SPV096 putative intermediate transcription factor VITF-3 [Swinepox virus]|uniref:Intermediate transcription factor 3 small subunit n=1 Tax=Swinepox virus (strain Swine/Nebraska/17077-99/1999) TaxID=300880 RepID=Q8V3K0_SWPV1|nr:SPV096 putative intermediate transcription factor VITF-3 [Swinepox virus]AAL69835.1 SPV096 putative intermediate transcription factor VITF-3 [Swinepox virus]UED36599.1 SPV096 putative intermediate transcription factor VITF-3 [Swinepox virus]UED36748.1 SPV096 putative intermediate transcription factor VITF-3 [Swinepox virus]UUA44286.1 SPV096 [Swinepox virus]